MALVTCSECGNEISSEAAACPNCGYTQTKKLSKKLIAGVFLLPFIFGWFVLVGRYDKRHKIICGILTALSLIGIAARLSQEATDPTSATDTATASQSTVPARQQFVNEDTEPAPSTGQQQPGAPIKHSHNYVMEEDGKYGYKGTIGKDDTDAGVSSLPLVMVQYLGIKNGEQRALWKQSGDMASILSCKAPCDYIKITTYTTYSAPDEQILPAGQTVANDIMMDAMNGYLKVYHAPAAPAPITMQTMPAVGDKPSENASVNSTQRDDADGNPR